jgi:hypothetical protein
MKTASIKELKTSLQNATTDELLDYCLHLIKYKKENKELITYLLYEKADIPQYIQSVKEILEEQFETVNKSTFYFAKKTLRKIIRTANKYIKYSKETVVDLEINLYIIETIKSLNFPVAQYKALENMYLSLTKKINKALATMHEDEQYDYLKRVALL